MEEYKNNIEIIELNEAKDRIKHVATVEHPYPATKLMWLPSTNTHQPDLLATTGDYLRLWEPDSNKTGGEFKLKVCLNNVRLFCTAYVAFQKIFYSFTKISHFSEQEFRVLCTTNRF